ncbi:MAG: ATP-binding protein [Bacteroidia bacterium]|nr:ATP-binding protein [Bacteroidia bacterium]
MSRKIIGRASEKETLQEAIDSHRSELIAVYGRRRIGKTYLIREFYKKQILFSFSGLRNGTLPNQLENFMLELNSITKDFKNEEPKSWLQAFHLLKTHLKGISETTRKKVIFIDEFPWVDSIRSGFLPAFENFWNTYCTTRNDIIVVICGSAASYMMKKIIKNRGGLHNRITRKIKLEPFKLKEVQDFFEYKGIKLPEMEIIKIYMAIGGVAEYLEHIKNGDSSVTAIDRLCFQKGAQLENEFEEVFKSLFEEGSYHEQIIRSLSNASKKGMLRTEILQDQELQTGGQFSKSMNELIESGFVEKYHSYRNKRKTTLYRIVDEFCLFHLQFIRTFKGNSWIQLYTKREYETWCGYSFELICLKHIECIKKALKCDQINSKNYSWSNSNAQVDLVIDRNDNLITLCEIKFSNDVFFVDEQYSNKLRKKESEFKNSTSTKKGVNTIMLTTWGISGNHSIGLVAQSITKECLFQ